MEQQFGDSLCDMQEPPKGARPYDPDVSEMAHHVAIVTEALDAVEHAALQLGHIAKGRLARLDRDADAARAFLGITSIPLAPE